MPFARTPCSNALINPRVRFARFDLPRCWSPRRNLCLVTSCSGLVTSQPQRNSTTRYWLRSVSVPGSPTTTGTSIGVRQARSRLPPPSMGSLRLTEMEAPSDLPFSPRSKRMLSMQLAPLTAVRLAKTLQVFGKVPRERSILRTCEILTGTKSARCIVLGSKAFVRRIGLPESFFADGQRPVTEIRNVPIPDNGA